MNNSVRFIPFSSNIIFYDTEFSSLDPYVGEILSIGAVKMDGREFYCELEYRGEYSEWVRENLLVTLTQPKLSRELARQKLSEFVGNSKPYALAYINQFDTIYTKKLFVGEGEEPFYWLPLDFASILFGLGYDPEVYKYDNYTKLAKDLGVLVKEGHTHNALDDARFLKDVYMALINRG